MFGTPLAARYGARATLYTDRAAWLAARPGQDRANIGASEAPCILGTGFRSPFEFWYQRTQTEDAAPDEQDCVPAEDGEHVDRHDDPLVRGNAWEGMVRQVYSLATGRPCVESGAALGGPAGSLAIVRHATIPWLGVSPDAFTVDDGDVGGVECKTSVTRGALWAPTGLVLVRADDYQGTEFDPGYLTQVYWQCEAMDLPFVDLAVLLGNYRLRWYRILRDEPTQRQLVDAIGAWREKHLVRGEAPPVDGSSDATAWLSRRYAAIRKYTVEADDAVTCARLYRFAEVKAIAKAADAEAKLLRNQLAETMGEATTLHDIGDRTRGVNLSMGARRAMTVYGFSNQE